MPVARGAADDPTWTARSPAVAGALHRLSLLQKESGGLWVLLFSPPFANLPLPTLIRKSVYLKRNICVALLASF